MTPLTILLAIALCSNTSGMKGDTCEDPILIEAGATSYDTTNLTSSGYDLYSDCTLMGVLLNDVWFEYVAPEEGVVLVSTCDPDSFDTSIIVYSSSNDGCDGLNYLACSGDAANAPKMSAVPLGRRVRGG